MANFSYEKDKVIFDTWAALDVSGYSIRFQTNVRNLPNFELPKFSSACLAASFALLSSSPFFSFTACLRDCCNVFKMPSNANLLNLWIILEGTARLDGQLIYAPELKLFLEQRFSNSTHVQIQNGDLVCQPEVQEHTCCC